MGSGYYSTFEREAAYKAMIRFPILMLESIESVENAIQEWWYA